MADEDDLDLKEAVRRLTEHADRLEAEQERQRQETARRIPGFLDRDNRRRMAAAYAEADDPKEVRRRRRAGRKGAGDE